VYDLRPICLVLGILLTTLGLAMLAPLAVDYAVDNPDWKVFAASAGITLFAGTCLWIANLGGQSGGLSLQQAFLLVTVSWVGLVAFAAIPLTLSELELDYTDAFFEAMSGITTTGSTVIVGLDTAPPGILLWRAILQWLGGIGIIVTAVAILPMLQIGGMQLFHMESSDTSDKMLPRAAQIAGSIAILYLLLSVLCMAAYWAAGMSLFDAVAHAMTTIATGGFSTYDRSLGHFESHTISGIATVFMILGSLPFVLYLQALAGKPGRLLLDTQVRWFFGILSVAIAAMFLVQVSQDLAEPAAAAVDAAFNVVSVMTGTGYATTDYGLWGGFAVTVFFILMFIGGCAGSTSCGIKIFRFAVMWSAVSTQMRRLRHPNGVFVPRYGGRPLDNQVIAAVMSFFFLFFVMFAILSVLLSLLGLDTITALSAAGTALANVGPGLGERIGPAGSFADLPDTAKWLLSLAMLLGRLELFTVLVLFTPAFWRG